MYRKKITLLALVGFMGLASWYVASPALAMSRLSDAALKADHAEMAKHIDLPAIRESLKAKVAAQMEERVKRHGHSDRDGITASNGVLPTALQGQIIDNVITSESLKELILSGELGRPAHVHPLRSGVIATRPLKWVTKHDGPNRFTARANVTAARNAASLIFKREGLEWRLAELAMPAADEVIRNLISCRPSPG